MIRGAIGLDSFVNRGEYSASLCFYNSGINWRHSNWITENPNVIMPYLNFYRAA